MTPLLDSAPEPRLFRDLDLQPEEAKSLLRTQKDPVFGFGVSLNPYRGCSHGCRYCYVREYPAPDHGKGKGALHDPLSWGRWVAPKVNAPGLLWQQRHKLHGATLFIGSATDPYQPIEREYRITRACLEVLLHCPTTSVIVHTRGPLVLQDVDLLKAFGPRLRVGFSIPTDDDTVRQIVEPDAPPIPSRWAVLERLSRAGVTVGVAAAPLMHVHDVQAFVRRAKASGASTAWVGGLRLLPKDPFFGVLADHQWLHVLDEEYVASIRSAFAEAFPRARRATRQPVRDTGHVLIPVSRDHQPSLFEALRA